MDKGNQSSSSQVLNDRGIKLEVWVAIFGTIVTMIGLFVTLIVALLDFEPFVALFRAEPTFTPTITPAGLTLTPMSFTDTPVVIEIPSITNTPEFTATSIEFPSPAVTETPSSTMYVKVYADKTTGKAPLTVKLDARDSYLQAFDGQIYGCRNGTCYYTWEVYAGGSRIGKPAENSTGTFQHTFGKQGTYMVTVWICRGQDRVDCGGNGVQIVVTK